MKFKYGVIEIETFRKVYHVIEREAGYDDAGYPNKTVARCEEKPMADRICRILNSTYLDIPDEWSVVSKAKYDEIVAELENVKAENKRITQDYTQLLREREDADALKARINAAYNTLVENNDKLIEVLHRYLPLPAEFTEFDLDRELAATRRDSARFETYTAAIADRDAVQQRLDDALKSATEWESRARGAETRMAMFDEDTRTKQMQNSIRNAEIRADNAWGAAKEIEVKMLRAIAERDRQTVIAQDFQKERDEWRAKAEVFPTYPGAYVMHPTADVVRDQNGNVWAKQKS